MKRQVDFIANVEARLGGAVAGGAMVEKAMAWIGFLGFICFAVWIIWFDRFLYRRRQKSNAIESTQVAQATSEALIRAGEDYLKAVEKRMDFHRQTGLAEDEAVKLTLTEVDAAFDRAVAKMSEEERGQHAKSSVSSEKWRVLLPLLRTTFLRRLLSWGIKITDRFGGGSLGLHDNDRN